MYRGIVLAHSGFPRHRHRARLRRADNSAQPGRGYTPPACAGAGAGTGAGAGVGTGAHAPRTRTHTRTCTHAHAPHCRCTHTRARATLPLHRCCLAAAPAAAPLLRGAASAAPLRRRCHVAAATVLPRGGSLHSNPPAKDLDPPEKAASSLPLRVVLAQSALVFVTRCASVFFYAREILISVFLDSSTCSSAVPTRRACA